ncbi:Lnb N-terminal periplasmic domain-containing protein [Brytella acorum]|uniref:Lnb N-terminal periplasmic domain-containing protein n=1 Tax=Brytella acorum TaxID=2959299 RepID=UPI0025AE772F|nr:DUF4105 domain-containing protein [Brytella acorum]MDF3623570.1 DUF4105 domain-containing protein [Brytella acorum]
MALPFMLMACFGAAAFWYSTIMPSGLRVVLAVLFPSLMLGIAFGVRRFRARVAMLAVLIIGFWGWYLSDPPRNDRDWTLEYAVPADAVFEGHVAHIRNVRDIRYRTVKDYTPHYYDADYDLDQLDGLDLVTSYWAGETIAHVFLSFSFRNGRHLAISIETRRQKRFVYSTIAGFFHHYELFYVVADERDLIGVRTDVRKERVYLYHVRVSPEVRRKLFVSYVNEIHDLAHRAQWYNTLTDNCTTGILARAGARLRYRFDWRVLLSGHTARLAYDLGLLDQNESFATLKRESRIVRPEGAEPGPDYSREIRVGKIGEATE